MKRLLVLLLGLMLIGCGGVQPSGSPVGEVSNTGTEQPHTPIGQNQLEEAQAKKFREAADVFAAGLLPDSGNAAISPLSIYTALSMAAIGAEGKTADQLYNLLCCADKAELAEINQSMLNMMNENDKASCLNSIWVQQGLDLRADYIEAMEKRFYADARQSDFTKTGEAEKINKWVNEKTNEVITSQLQDNPYRVMALVNATWMKDQWDGLKFEKDDTIEQDFYGADATGKVRMMHTRAGVKTWSGEDYRAISILLKETGEMIFVLPVEGADPLQLIRDRGLDRILTQRDTAGEENLEISIPRFDIEHHTELSEGLQALGVTDAFDRNNADFSAMANRKETEPAIFISKVLHGARVIAEEEGVTAAAYTIVDMDGGAANMEQPEPFVLDRPFAFAIVRQGLPLFVGVIRDAGMGG